MEVQRIYWEGFGSKRPYVSEIEDFAMTFRPTLKESHQPRNKSSIKQSTLWDLLKKPFPDEQDNVKYRRGVIAELEERLKEFGLISGPFNIPVPQENSNFYIGAATGGGKGGSRASRNIYLTNQPSTLVIVDDSILEHSSRDYMGVYLATNVPPEETFFEC
jgi:hypothetical protein